MHGQKNIKLKISVMLATFTSNMLVQARTPLVTALKIKMTVYCTDSVNAVLLTKIHSKYLLTLTDVIAVLGLLCGL